MITAKVTFTPGPALKAAGKAPQATLEGLQDAAELILAASRDLVPLEEGTLERSGRVTTDGVSRVAISYDTPYAVRQHEDLTLRHTGGRSAKYLERPFMSMQAQVRAIVAQRVKKALGG